MKHVIKEIKDKQNKMLVLLEELRHARKLEKMKAKHEIFFVLTGGFLWQYPTGQACWPVSDGEIKSFLNLRKAITRGCVLDLDNRIKRVYKHKSRGKK